MFVQMVDVNVLKNDLKKSIKANCNNMLVLF